MSYQKLYDIGSLPDSMLKQKYLQTKDAFQYEDPNTIQNYMMETLRNTSSDAPLFEQDLPRKSLNPIGQSLLSMQEHGSRYSHAPFHPELFLGDLTSDPRMSSTAPLTAQMAEQNRFRQSRYISGKLQDVADVRSEGMVGTKRMIQQVKQGFNDTATRMGGLFDDSTDNVVRKSNPHPGNSTHKVGDSLKEDQKIYETQGEKILPSYGTDIVGKLSNMIGVQWDVQPEAKQGISSVSNVYRSKQEVDKTATAVFRLGEQDTKFKEGKSGFKNGTTVKQIDSFKGARKNIHNTVVATKKDSMNNKFRMKMLPPPVPINHVDRFAGTQATKAQKESRSITHKYHSNQNRVESLVEPLKGTSTLTRIIPSTIPVKDRVSMVNRIGRTHKGSNRSEDKSSAQSMNVKNLAKALVARPNPMEEQAKAKNFNLLSYTNSVPNVVDHVSNTEMTTSKFAGAKEHITNNATGSNIQIAAPMLTDFQFDTDPTMNNNYQTRRGLNQKTTRLTAVSDHDNTISPLSDTIVPYRTKY